MVLNFLVWFSLFFQSPAQAGLVVLADPADPYFRLAEEIAAVEGAQLATSVEEALAAQPEYLLWVVSPGFLSDLVMVRFGHAVQASRLSVSTGIITASTLDGARSLWQRRDDVRGEKCYSVNAANPAAHIDTGRLVYYGQPPSLVEPLSKHDLVSALAAADYLTFTGHGSNAYLRIDDGTTLRAEDLPALDGVVVATGSCQTVRLWMDGSIALAFVDQGAAAYTGFVYSPNEGFLIGEFDGLPFRYTWPAFPVGHVLQAQNRGTLQGFATFPYQYLLGDPRIALQSQPPYQMRSDRQQGQWRVLEYSDLPAGVVPVRIQGGAGYAFVQARGITAAADSDPFYNSRMQSANIGADKYLLVDHPGGDLTLRLRQRAPFYWLPLDALLDSLDHTYIFSVQTGGDVLSLAFSVLPLVWVGWQVIKQRLNRLKMLYALGFGAVVALLQAAYALLRLDDVTITSKTLVFSPLSILAAFLLAFCAALIFLQARRWLGEIVALLVMTFPAWSAGVFGLVAITLMNQAGFLPRVGAALYNHSMNMMALIAFAVTAPPAAAGLVWLRRLAIFSLSAEDQCDVSAMQSM